jgi:hypothetical protein
MPGQGSLNIQSSPPRAREYVQTTAIGARKPQEAVD